MSLNDKRGKKKSHSVHQTVCMGNVRQRVVCDPSTSGYAYYLHYNIYKYIIIDMLYIYIYMKKKYI